MFIRYVAHEVRTPLNVVILGLKVLVRLLDSGAHRDECMRTINEIAFSSSEAVNILNDMLLYDKIESNVMKLELEDLEIWDLVVETTTPFRLQVRLVFVQFSQLNSDKH